MEGGSRIQMDLNLLGLQNLGFLTNTLNYLTTKRLLEKSYALKVIYTTAGSLDPASCACPLLQLQNLLYIKKSWSKPRQKYRTQKKMRPEAIDLGLCSTFSLAYSPWFWVARCTYFWRKSEQLDILRRGEKRWQQVVVPFTLAVNPSTTHSAPHQF